MIINLILVLIIILLIILLVKFNCESFNGYVFAPSPPPPYCSPHNNCFQGHTSRNALYSNMCEPVNFDSCGRKLISGQGLLKDRVYLEGNCYRAFKN